MFVLSSLYSISPIIAGYRNIIGSLIYSENTDTAKEYYDQQYTQQNPNDFYKKGVDRLLFIIRHCSFNSIIDPLESNPEYNFIYLDYQTATFYITSCTFQACSLHQGLILYKY